MSFYQEVESPIDQMQDGAPVVRILMIEDDTCYFRFVHHLLQSCNSHSFELLKACSLQEAEKILSCENLDVILLDLLLPDGDGLANIDRVRIIAGGAPIVVLTCSDDSRFGLKAVAQGAQDYIVKQKISNDSLIRSILYAIERRRSEESILRLSTIRDFTATLAHDLQVPMIGCSNVFNALLGGQFGELPEDAKTILFKLEDSSKKQLQLVQRLLKIYRYDTVRQGHDFSNLNVEQIIQRCVAQAQLQSRANEPSLEGEQTSDNAQGQPSIEINIVDELPSVSGDAEALEILFANLIDNAIKFGDGKEPIRISAQVVDSNLVVQVHNSGPAISDAVQRNIFHKFWQGVPGKSYVPYTGLGLYLCQSIVRLHKGKIACQSGQEDGSTFTVRLPIIPSGRTLPD